MAYTPCYKLILKMKFYKGDIIYEQKDHNGNEHDMLWAINVFGVLKDTDCENKYLFYRPFKNHVKYLLWRIFKICL